MSQGGQVTLVGYVVGEPKLRFVNNGTPVVNLRVGSTSRRIDRSTGEWCDGDTSYFTVACWRTLASNVASCLRKGEPVIIRGKFRSSSYEDRNGQSRSSVDIEAEAVGHDLSKGVAHFQRTRGPAVDLAALAAGEAIRAGLDLPDGATGEFDSVPAVGNVVSLASVRRDAAGPAPAAAGERADAEPDRDEPDRDEPDRDEPDRDEPDRDEPDRDEPDRDEPDRDEPDRDDPDRDENRVDAAGPAVSDGPAPVGTGLDAADRDAVFNDEAVLELAREVDPAPPQRAAA